jgi:class 3 adenylate cyclase
VEKSRRRVRVSIRYKLALLLLAVGGAAAVVSGGLGYYAAGRSLRESVLERLQGVRRTKGHQVESYFRTLRSQAVTLGDDRVVLELMRGGSGGDGRVLQVLLKRLGYADLLLLDGKSGRILYSAAGGHPDAGAALQAVYEQARTAREDGVFLSDMEGGAVFAASPMWDQGAMLGVLALKINVAELDRLVSGEGGWERDGLGRSGDAVIVGGDLKPRSTARTPGGRNVGALAAAAVAGSEGFAEAQERLISYGPLAIPGLQWALVTEIDETEAMQPVMQLGRRLLLWGSLMALLMAGVVVLVANRFVRPLGVLFRAARRVASGHFDTRVPILTHDELGLLSAQLNSLASSIRRQSAEIQQKNRENEALLLNILPGPIADRLKGGEQKIVDSFPCVTVLFADIVGFTVYSGTETPDEVVAMLNRLFTHFDGLAARHGVEKIKTIGDAYMAVAGLPSPCEDHARRIVEMARGMLEEVRRHSRETGIPIAIRIGVNSGPVVAGVIGSSKFIYDLWGDTVNVASRMESHGVPDRVQVTGPVYELLRETHQFECRGEIEVKGKGKTMAWLLREP